MGGGASTCIGRNNVAQSKMILDTVQVLQERSVITADGTLFRPRQSQKYATIAGMDQRFTERWGLAGEEKFNVAALELLSTLLHKDTASEKEKLVSFEQWLNDKSSVCYVSVQKKHINAVSTSIKQQQALPEDCLNLLDKYLEDLSSNFDVVARINAVSNEHAHDLKSLAEEHQFVHHDVPHALEIELRTMNMLKKLNIWQTDAPRDAFFRAIIACMIRHHDHEQKNEIQGTSNEEVTASRVISWLNIALNFSDDEATAEIHAVKKIMEFMAHRIIVCGTTMIYSQKRTLDLIELLFALEKAVGKEDVLLLSKSNQNFIDMMNITAILAGANDKNPGASLLNVLDQLKQPSMTTLPLIKDYYGEVSVLDKFFSSSKFKAYYNLDMLREHYHEEGFAEDYNERDFFEVVDKQAFLMMVVPHICMRPELLKTTAEHRVKIRAFIQTCRANLCLDADTFKAKFETMFVDYHVAEIMNAIFFEKIDSEAEFSRSQKGGLTEMAKKNLPRRGLKREEVVYSLIDPNVPLKDAIHLKELKIFCDGLTPQNKITLSKELVMTVVLQAGAMKALELGLVESYVEESGVKATF